MPEAPPSNDLILSAATRYRPADLEIFLRSAATNVPQANVLLVTEKRSPGYLAQLRTYHPRVRLWHPPDGRIRRRIWGSEKRVRRLRHPRRFDALKAAVLLHSPWPKRALAVMHISVARHFWFRQLLEEGVDQGAERILLADCRDVYFQADPFPAVEEKILVGEEHRWITPKTYVSKYVRRVYGPDIEERMQSKAILCAGVVLGTRSAIYELEREWTGEFKREATSVHGRFVDQIVLNKMLYADGRVPFRPVPEGGAIMTQLIFTPPEMYGIEKDGVRTAAGERVRIVHRYDRHPEMKAYAEATYRRPTIGMNAATGTN